MTTAENHKTPTEVEYQNYPTDRDDGSTERTPYDQCPHCGRYKLTVLNRSYTTSSGIKRRHRWHCHNCQLRTDWDAGEPSERPTVENLE